MSRLRIYVSMSTLLVPNDHPDQQLHAGIAPYARPFLTWAADQGKVVLLTDGPLASAIHLLERLDCSGKVSIATFESSKTEKISPDERFFWVDDFLIPGEVSWLLEHQHQGRVIAVQPHKGVTPETKQALDAKIHTR